MYRYYCLVILTILFSCTNSNKGNEKDFLIERDVPRFIDALKDLSQTDKAKAFEQMRTALQYELVERPSTPGTPEAQSPLQKGKSQADGQMILFASALVPHSDANEFAVVLMAFPKPVKGKIQELVEKKLGNDGMTMKDGKAQWKINGWILTVDDQKIAYSAVSDKSVYDYFEEPSNQLPDTIDISDYTDHDTETEAPEEVKTLDSKWPKPTTFTDAQLKTMQQAWNIADAAIKDSLFTKILLEMTAANDIEWGPSRIISIPAAHRANPAAFILSEFDKKGLPGLNDFQAMLYRPGSPTTGSTLPCGAIVNVNVNKLTRSLADIAGTMVHERVHSFCQQHINNRREANICDMAYISGSLGIAIYYYRANGSKPFSATESLCPALNSRLRTMGIIK